MSKTQSIILVFLLFLITDIYCQDTLSVKDVFNFNIGDLFHYEEDASDYIPGGFYSKVDRITITDKYFSANMDTVFYRRAIEGYTENLVPTTPPSPYPYEWKYYFHSSSDTVFYTNLDSSIFYSLSEGHFKYLQDYDWNNDDLIQSDSLVFKSEEYCKRTINGYYFSEFSINDRVEYGDGLGVTTISTEVEECMCHVKSLKLIYFEKGTESCGTPDSRTNTGLNPVPDNELIMVSPNPASEFILIQISEDLNRPTLQIYNSLGQIVFQKVLEHSIERVNLHEIKSGLYYIHISNSSRIIPLKLLKY